MNIAEIEEKTIDEAINHFENATDEQLFEFLDGDDDVLKQIAVLKLEKVSSSGESFSSRLYEFIINSTDYTGYSIISNLGDFFYYLYKRGCNLQKRGV